MKNFHLCISFKCCIRKFDISQYLFILIFCLDTLFFSLEPLLKVEKRITEISWGKGKLELVKGVLVCEIFRVRLNYATTHKTYHHPPPSKIYPPPPTTSQNMSPTMHHYPPPAKICPPPPTTSQNVSINAIAPKICPPLPTISQKMDHYPTKAKIYSHMTSFRHCFPSWKN